MNNEGLKNKLANRIYPASVTPFASDGSINAEAARNLLQMNLRQGATGFFIRCV